MKNLKGYLKTIANYCKNPKGRHDILDYLRAFAIFGVTAIFIVAVLRLLR